MYSLRHELERRNLRNEELCNMYSSNTYYCFVVGRSQVQISALRPATLTDVFRGFPQSLH
jgi:hypothetical protein